MRLTVRAVVTALCLTGAVFTAQAQQANTWVYIGTRGLPTPEQAAKQSPQGIYAARLDANTGKVQPLGLQIEVLRASWLVTYPGKPWLYSVARDAAGAEVDVNIHSFAIDPTTGKLREISKTSSGALGTTHLAVDAKSNTLFGAGFDSSVVTALPIESDGSVGKVTSTQKHYGTGPHARQQAPHPHGVAIDPSGKYMLSTDLGADRIFIYRFDAARRTLTPAAKPFEQMPVGSGPRHLVFHPNGKFFYANTELTAELNIYSWDAAQGVLKSIATQSTYPAGYTGKDKSSAELAFSKDGRFLYVCLRGDQDSMVVYEVNPQTGIPKEVQRLPSQGKRPWSFGIDPSGRWMLVANEASGKVNVFSIDTSTGKLTPTNESLSVPNPAVFAFYPN